MHGRGGRCVEARVRAVSRRCRCCVFGRCQRAGGVLHVWQGRQGSDAEHETKMCWMYGQLQAEHGLEFATPAEAATWLEHQSLPSPPEPEPEPEPALGHVVDWRLEWMRAGAGLFNTALFNKAAKKNPLRWTGGTPAQVSQGLKVNVESDTFEL